MSRLIVSDLPIGTKQPINIDDVYTFEKFDNFSISEEKGRHQIMFVRDENSIGPREIFWKYKKECDRNADYDKLIENYTSKL